MTATVRATYENGLLRPAEPLPLADGEAVELTVTRTPPPGLTQEEALRRIREAKTWEEMLEASDAAAVFDPPLPPGYDLLEELNRQRVESGQRPLIPADRPGAP